MWSQVAIRSALAVILLATGGAATVSARARPAGSAVDAGPDSSALAPVSTAPRYRAPLPEPLQVVRGFQPPTTPYGPGHRGVDLAATARAPVRAAAAGVVSFAGQVAGRGVVVVAHADGIRTEYEPVRPLVHTGSDVAAGEVIATLHGHHAGCPKPCLHWGARRGSSDESSYLDPLQLLRPLGPVTLLPWSRPAPGQARGWARW